MRKFMANGSFWCVCFLAGTAMGQVPLFDLNVDGQTPGTEPRADIGQASVFPPGVTVESGAFGTGNSIHLSRADTQPRLFCLPLGGALTTGQRTLTFVFSYNDSAGASPNFRQLDIFLRPEDLSASLLDLKVAGGTGQVSLNGVDEPGFTVSLGTAHTVQIDIDASARKCSITIDSGRGVLTRDWANGITQFAVIEFALTTPAGAGAGDAHLDSIKLINPNQTLHDWANPVSGNWDDSANWTPPATPTSGDAIFIRAPSTGHYTVQGAGSATSGSILAMVNPSGGVAELRLSQNLNVAAANINIGAQITVLSGARLDIVTQWLLGGTIKLEGGSLRGDTFSNAGAILGTGDISAALVSTAPGSTVRSEGGPLQLLAGPISHEGKFDCNGESIRLGLGVQLSQSGDGRISLNGGTFASPTKLELNGTTGARFDGPGRLELAGTFTTSLTAAQMKLDGVDIVLIGDATIEALSEDVGGNNDTLTGIPNVINSLSVGSHVLTLRSDFDNDPSAAGISKETALYVRNLDLSGTTTDVSGGKVYYLNLVAGTNPFANYISLATASMGSEQPGTNPSSGSLCGACGAASPAFSIAFVGGYAGLLMRRRARRRR